MREDNILPYKFKGFIFIRFNVITAPPATPLGGGAFPIGNIFLLILLYFNTF